MKKNNNSDKVKGLCGEVDWMRTDKYIREFLEKEYSDIKEGDERYDDLYMSCMGEALKALPDYVELIPLEEYLKPRLENACRAYMIHIIPKK